MSLIEIKNSSTTFASIDKPNGKVELNTKDKLADDFITIESAIEEWAGDIVIPPYLCFEAVEATDIKWEVGGAQPLTVTPELYYSMGNTHNWQKYTIGNTINLSVGQNCYWKSTTSTFNESYNKYIRFSSTGKVAASGEVDSIINWSPLTPHCYEQMFYNCTTLIKAPELPATTLAESCYFNMFENCSELVYGPSVLPALTLPKECYDCMFYHCGKLIEAPQILATKGGSSCCWQMYDSCVSLTTVPDLYMTTIGGYCYRSMFINCTGLVKPPKIYVENFDESVGDSWGYCDSMFKGCISLTGLPQLKATQLADGCYYDMFSGCSSIKLSTNQTGDYQTPYRIPIEGTGVDADYALDDMFNNTGGTFTGTPTINATYYTSNEVI